MSANFGFCCISVALNTGFKGEWDIWNDKIYRTCNLM